MSMKLPTIIRLWQIIGRTSPWLMHADVLAELFQGGSLPSRLLRAAGRADYSARIALRYATSRYVAQWPIITSQFVLQNLHRFGTLLVSASMPDHDAQVLAWDFGGHLIVQSRTDGNYDHRSLTDNDDLIRVAVELTTAELGAPRLYIGRDGLVADSSDYGEHVTEQARQLIDEIRSELATGETSRTILLHGPPGSGKSTMARQIAAAFGETIVAIDGVALAEATGGRVVAVGEEHGLGERVEHVSDIVKHCGAQAVVVDDYDRQTNEGFSLAFIRDLRATARVVVFTANDRKAFSGAELRPRRFDKIVRVDSLDLATAQSIAPDLPESIRERAHGTLLAAYLHELAVLCRAHREPEQAYEDLLQRQQLAENETP